MIATAVNRTPTQVYVYNERGSVITTITGTLLGYTANSVTVRRNPVESFVYVYTLKGNRWDVNAIRAR